jgi:hypothetical protein
MMAKWIDRHTAQALATNTVQNPIRKVAKRIDYYRITSKVTIVGLVKTNAPSQVSVLQLLKPKNIELLLSPNSSTILYRLDSANRPGNFFALLHGSTLFGLLDWGILSNAIV